MGLDQYRTDFHHGLIYPADDRDFNNLLNKRYNAGYELHSIIPQNGTNGETEYNILIFKKIDG